MKNEYETQHAKMDLNKVTEQELRRIDGVTDVLARKIVEWRRQNGAFRTIDDLDRVEGVNTAQREQLRRSVIVRPT